MRTILIACAVAFLTIAGAGARNMGLRGGESYVPQLSPSARVKPEAPKAQAKPQTGAQTRPNAPSCTSENASSPECSASTLQSAPVQTAPVRTR
jgi:hypothetical protein